MPKSQLPCPPFRGAGHEQRGGLIASFPPERLTFDASGIPTRVRTAFEEAITCHAGEALIAAAMLVRKTLEELCADRGASGADLYKRLEALQKQVVLPPPLFAGLDRLRILGNDAAHVEARTYNEITRGHVEAAIEFAREVLKAVYQYEGLLKKLEALPQPPPAGAAGE